jgi:hypothetical protein
MKSSKARSTKEMGLMDTSDWPKLYKWTKEDNNNV